MYVDEALALIPWPAQLGIIASLILTIVTILVRHERQISKGDLVPRITHDEIVAHYKSRADDFRELWQITDKRVDVMEGVAGDVVVIGESVNRLLKAFPGPKEGA